MELLWNRFFGSDTFLKLVPPLDPGENVGRHRALIPVPHGVLVGQQLDGVPAGGAVDRVGVGISHGPMELLGYLALDLPAGINGGSGVVALRIDRLGRGQIECFAHEVHLVAVEPLQAVQHGCGVHEASESHGARAGHVFQSLLKHRRDRR